MADKQSPSVNMNALIVLLIRDVVSKTHADVSSDRKIELTY